MCVIEFSKCQCFVLEIILFCAPAYHYTSDIDECAESLDNCSMFAVCDNTDGSFNCTCNPGLEGDGVNCTGTIIIVIPASIGV